MATSRHTCRMAASACSSSVRPFSCKAALSRPMRVLLPPARTKPETWEWTIALIVVRVRAPGPAKTPKNRKGHAETPGSAPSGCPFVSFVVDACCVLLLYGDHFCRLVDVAFAVPRLESHVVRACRDRHGCVDGTDAAGVPAYVVHVDSHGGDRVSRGGACRQAHRRS